MSLTAEAIAQNIVNQAKLLDPTLSAEIGTPERKIIDALSEQLASAQVDFTVLNTQTDLSSLSGGRLDAYLAVFNFGRQQAVPAIGQVTFTRNLATQTLITIPRGTQIQANLNSTTFPSLIFVTTDTVVMDINTNSVTVGAQCVVAGSIGNIDANTISGFAGLQAVTGIAGVSNTQAFTKGADQETDDAYRARFQNMFMRNISGTTDMFLALAVAQNGVTKANVLGAISRYQEYLLIPSADDVGQRTVNNGYDPNGTIWPHKRTTAVSTITFSQYTYPVNHYVTDSTLDPATAQFFRAGVDYVFNTPPIDATHIGGQQTTSPVTSPNITILATAGHGGNPSLTDGATLLLEHAYISTHSRNNASFSIYNCVDVYTNGDNEQSVSSEEAVPPATQVLQSSNAGSWLYQVPGVVNNFTRTLDSTPAAVGSMIEPLYWQPVTSLPNSITVGSSTYYLANFYDANNDTYYNQFDGTTYSFPAHYILVEETNANFGTVRARNGIEWFLSGNNHLAGQLPADSGQAYGGSTIDTQISVQFTVSQYSYDANVSTLQAVMEKNKQTSQDVLVHRTRFRYFQPIVTIMYNFGVTQAVVNASISAALNSFFQNHYYGTVIQMSDILQVIHNVPGVDNVRFTNPNGNKVQEVTQAGDALTVPVLFTGDFFIQDSELAASPNNNAVVITTRTQNTFNS